MTINIEDLGEEELDHSEVFSSAYKESICKMKKLITLFNHSAVLKGKLNNETKKDNMKQFSMLSIIEISWNSIFLAVQRFLEMMSQIERVVTEETVSQQQ